MLIYEIPYRSDKTPNAFSDSLAFITSNHDEYCLFKISPSISPECIHIIFSEKFIDYFSPLLEAHEAKKLDKLPAFEQITLLGGNEKLLMKP